MAAVTLATTLSQTANTTSYVSDAFTPNADDLLAIFVGASGTADPGAVTDTQSLGWTKIAVSAGATSADRVYLFISNAKTAAASMRVTFTCAGDAATGANLCILRISGMTNVGSAAVRQKKEADNQAAGGTPQVVLDSACLTSNPVIGTVGNGANPAGITEPSGWAEQADVGYGTPARGTEVASIDSGFTSNTVTWGATSATAFSVIAAELDASAPTAGQPYAKRIGGIPGMNQMQPGWACARW